MVRNEKCCPWACGRADYEGWPHLGCVCVCVCVYTHLCCYRLCRRVTFVGGYCRVTSSFLGHKWEELVAKKEEPRRKMKNWLHNDTCLNRLFLSQGLARASVTTQLGPAEVFSSRILFYFIFLACGILFPRPGIEPRAPAVRVPSPNYGTAREFPL